MKLTIGNARTKVDGSDSDRKWLSDVLSIDTGKPDIKRGGSIIHRFYSPKESSFPSGLLVYVLKADCPSDVTIDLDDQRTKVELPSEPVWLDGLEKRDYQIEAVRRMLTTKRGLIHAATNAGKSAVLTSFLKTVQPCENINGILLIHRKELFDQLLSTLRKHLPKGCVGSLGGKSVDVNRQFVVCMYRTLTNRIGDDSDVTRLYKNHQLIMLDEVHHLSAAGLQELFLNSDAPLRFGFSGTVPEPYTLAGMQCRAHTGKVLIKIGNQELIDRGISAVPTVYYRTRNWASMFRGFYDQQVEVFSMKHPEYLPLFRSGGGFRSTFIRYRFFAEYSAACFDHGVVHNEDRNADIAREVLRRDTQALLITERVEHGRNLAKAFSDAGADARFIHGTSEDRDVSLDLFRKGKLRTLISTWILDEGVDVSGIRLLVLAGTKKCKRSLLQRIGRGLRKKETGPNELAVLDYLDLGNKYLEKYSLERRQTLKNEGFKIVEEQ